MELELFLLVADYLILIRDLQVITQDVKRVVLILGDYPNFDNQDYETLRFQLALIILSIKFTGFWVE
ncbi:hypothetical protein PN480_19985 [Dolichospermum circinale CS-1225]|uniref:Uncharacterized protein n=1 Tax=Dolichospermum circinale CS-537/01 TaxID=3021739 RepID=A0ABT4ZZH2_9CYAN|nr:hypothetical protein [Dolichospermum circinale]MDB9459167.1 hypothetical protein [Dolichospermum circinale CS-545/17]MDB9453200.1 hypothetical protein [Dolichospermum circinale CS-541/06]MDB9460869.1 hypothetical protein [Dolichospermum circinale CS-541/04]MDB9466910.1 hypothetical protein [Dolichospermum circinale CS-539/09]MDB9472140.1 hypothetical protein [Dolichospermum circinale CS-539]